MYLINILYFVINVPIANINKESKQGEKNRNIRNCGINAIFNSSKCRNEIHMQKIMEEG